MTLYDILIMPPFLLFARTFDKVMWPAQINISIRLWYTIYIYIWPAQLKLTISDQSTHHLKNKKDNWSWPFLINLHTTSNKMQPICTPNQLKCDQSASVCVCVWPAQTNTSATNVHTGLLKEWSHWTFFKPVWHLKGGESGSQKPVRQSLQPVNYVSLIQSCIWLRVQWGCSNVENIATVAIVKCLALGLSSRLGAQQVFIQISLLFLHTRPAQTSIDNWSNT